MLRLDNLNAEECQRVSDAFMDHGNVPGNLGQLSVWLAWYFMGDAHTKQWAHRRILRCLPDLRRDYGGERG
jgi:hypothetical protein